MRCIDPCCRFNPSMPEFYPVFTKDEVDLLRLQTGSGALTKEMLESSEPMGIIDRVIVKYRLKVGEAVDGALYVPAGRGEV